ncbi:hypothetical protein COU57_00835 [Candidatus Pacearchaeota archaeon CG10_big_fil_rev_8_21_14_0_10_32_14]|nr:MAG: hypothetical protein COU57_00835 [Candidatus Pacearchaeota archaeon CG10_big_fil_rev_8_21_14_0_10_32_14]
MKGGEDKLRQINKKGLSTIVTTLIMVLLVIVAIMIVWGVVNGMLSNTKSRTETLSKCTEISIQTSVKGGTSPTDQSRCGTQFVAGGSEDCQVTVERKLGGGGTIDGLKIVVSDGTSSISEDFTASTGETGNLGEVASKTFTVDQTTATTLIDAVGTSYKITAVPFFLDASGKQVYCNEATYTFSHP